MLSPEEVELIRTQSKYFATGASLCDPKTGELCPFGVVLVARGLAEIEYNPRAPGYFVHRLDPQRDETSSWRDLLESMGYRIEPDRYYKVSIRDYLRDLGNLGARILNKLPAKEDVDA